MTVTLGHRQQLEKEGARLVLFLRNNTSLAPFQKNQHHCLTHQTKINSLVLGKFKLTLGLGVQTFSSFFLFALHTECQ
ncbi:hypothetical protein CCP3SC1_200016 [Gammaproteobacteria bacterium]